jgi:hypothetical protein
MTTTRFIGFDAVRAFDVGAEGRGPGPSSYWRLPGLGQTGAHHVADAQQHDAEPCPISLEIVSVPVGSP